MSCTSYIYIYMHSAICLKSYFRIMLEIPLLDLNPGIAHTKPKFTWYHFNMFNLKNEENTTITVDFPLVWKNVQCFHTKNLQEWDHIPNVMKLMLWEGLHQIGPREIVILRIGMRTMWSHSWMFWHKNKTHFFSGKRKQPQFW